MQRATCSGSQRQRQQRTWMPVARNSQRPSSVAATTVKGTPLLIRCTQAGTRLLLASAPGSPPAAAAAACCCCSCALPSLLLRALPRAHQ